MSLKITAEEIYKSILFRAADIYEVEYEDVERDIGQQFDPIVRFMSGALASELERVYQHVYDTESRLQKRLAKILLPEYFHLPQPAHALAVANAASDALIIDETLAFETEFEEEDKGNISFTPLFPQKILPVEVKIIATENHIIDTKTRISRRSRNRRSDYEEVRRIAIGFTAPMPITDWHGTVLYFDLQAGQDTEKTLLFAALSGCRCTLGGMSLMPRPGLARNELILEDYLNGNERLQKSVRARYEQHFVTLTNSEVEEVSPVLPEEYLKERCAEIKTEAETKAYLKGISEEQNKPLYWLEFELAKPVHITDVASCLSVKFNVFPVVNRRLNGDKRGEHHFMRNNSIKWVALQPTEDFLAIRRVFEEKPPEYPLYTFKPFADFKEERKPSYTLRHGGIGRWDDFNAWQRLAYVVQVLQENYKHKELVEEAAGALSLEDVHHLLGKRISKTAADEKPTRDVYVLLHGGTTAGIRVRVEYWTSVGTEANDIPAKAILKCISKHKTSLDKDSLNLVTSTSDGRAPLNSTQQLYAMKSALLSRDRIVTREDVKVFCQSFLQEKLEEVVISDGVGVDPRFDFGMTRLLDVRLRPTKEAIKEDWAGLCRQIQNLLESKSTSSIPIRVQLMLDDKNVAA